MSISMEILSGLAYTNKVRGATRRKSFISMVENCKSSNALFFAENVFPGFDGKKYGGTSSRVFNRYLEEKREA